MYNGILLGYIPEVWFSLVKSIFSTKYYPSTDQVGINKVMRINQVGKGTYTGSIKFLWCIIKYTILYYYYPTTL